MMNRGPWSMAALFVVGAYGIAPAQPAISSGPASVRTPADCERVAQLAEPGTTIVRAEHVSAGAFTGPPAVFSGLDLSAFYKQLPAFCRVTALAQPAPDSRITIEVWLPMTGWNRKFRGLGNGGFAGQIDYRQLGTAVSFGYAGAATDTGHTGSPLDASWALGHPEKVTDFGHRGIHEMTRAAKAIVRALFGNAPERSYFSGCSNGGRQALMEALRYPDDYDGILAGAPANDWTRLLASAVANSQALMLQDASYIGPAKVPAIAAAVVAACDAKDAVSDGILSDPRQCGFDPAALLCTEGDSNTCLTAPQVTALKKIYDGPRDSKGAPVFPGYSPGAEDGPGGWAPWITGQAPGKSLMFGFGVGYFANMVYEKADWDFRTFKLEPALQEAERKTAATLNATDPNLKPFMERGGKLILYHGWADAAIPPLNTLRYYEKVTSTMGAREADSVLRLYLVPGMQHCAGGPGTDWLGQDGVMLTSNPDRNVLAALERWVEAGVAPSMIVAARHPGDDPAQKPVMTRPLCPHPQVAKYNGSGDTNDAANFVCVSPGS